MNLKHIATVLLCAAAMAAAPYMPGIRSVVQDNSITAEAADSCIGQFWSGNFGYQLYQTGSGTKYAVIASAVDSQTLTVGATVTHQSVSYPIRKIKDGAIALRTVTTFDLTNASNLQEIGANAFSGSTVKYVRIGGGNLTIKQEAFRSTPQLQYVYVYSSVTDLTIEQNAFTESGLKYFYCYADRVTLKTKSFERSTNLRSMYLYSDTDTATIQTAAFAQSGITNLNVYCRNITIAQNAFSNPSSSMTSASLSNVYFGSNTSIITLYDHAFNGLWSLGTVTISNPNADLFLGKAVFSGSTLRTINLPNTTTSIPEDTFSYCGQLSCFPVSGSVTSIGKNAFSHASLPDTVYIPAGVTFIDPTAFTYAQNVSSFSVPGSNPNYKSVGGVLYSKDGFTLLCFPEKKESYTLNTTASLIPDGAIYNNKFLHSVSIPNFARPYNEQVSFYGLDNLEYLTIPSSEYNNRTGENLIYRYSDLFLYTNLHNINNVEIVETPDGSEPRISEKFRPFVEANLDNYQLTYYYFMEDYANKMADYVVSSVTNSSMSPLKKAVRLHEWICARTTYDPREIADPDFSDYGNHTEYSVFLHKELINGTLTNVTVCEGYARCYKRLLNKAGIETQYVSGGYYDSNDKYHGHAWNLLKLNNKWYHVDVTWDDQNNDNASNRKNRYKYFLCPDEVFNTDGHSNYNWSSEDDPSLNKASGAATDYNYYRLGDLNDDHIYNSTDQNRFDQIANGAAPTTMQAVRGDLNFDGQVNSTDRNYFNSYINNYKSTYSRPALWRFCTLEY